MIMSVDPASDLRARVKAAVQEYDTVVQFHESWADRRSRQSPAWAGQPFLCRANLPYRAAGAAA
jgi:hypothetical protein